MPCDLCIGNTDHDVRGIAGHNHAIRRSVAAVDADGAGAGSPQADEIGVAASRAGEVRRNVNQAIDREGLKVVETEQRQRLDQADGATEPLLFRTGGGK
ncbi:hypothetical protein BH10PLA2_BH10PLA2_24240 [soil metagenome]